MLLAANFWFTGDDSPVAIMATCRHKLAGTNNRRHKLRSPSFHVGLPLHNVGHYKSSHAHVPPLDVAEVVRQKYALDVELWDVVSRRGVLCW